MIRRAALALRVLLGAVFIYAAYTKLRQSWLLFALSIDSYQLLPEWAVYALARTLPALELALGVLLVAGVWLRYLSVAATAILALFFSVMVVSYFRGAGNRLRLLRRRRATEPENARAGWSTASGCAHTCGARQEPTSREPAS